MLSTYPVASTFGHCGFRGSSTRQHQQASSVTVLGLSGLRAMRPGPQTTRCAAGHIAPKLCEQAETP